MELIDQSVSREHAKIIYNPTDRTFNLINESVTNPVRVNGTAVESVMIGGRMVLDKGQFTTINLAALRHQAEEAVARLAAANVEARALSEQLHPVVGMYCSGWAAAPHHVHRFCGHAAH